MQAKYLDSPNPNKILTISNPPSRSPTWNFMISSRYVVTTFLSWQVHNKFTVLFWKDSWNGFPPLCSVSSLDQVMHVASTFWGDLLINYVDHVDLITHQAIWKDPNILPIDLSTAKELSDILATCLIYLSNDNDKIIWCPSKDGVYFVKSGYVAL